MKLLLITAAIEVADESDAEATFNDVLGALKDINAVCPPTKWTPDVDAIGHAYGVAPEDVEYFDLNDYELDGSTDD